MLTLTEEDKERQLAALKALKEERMNTNKLKYYRPYTKQRLFHEAGFSFDERLFMAGNQLGKTWAGGFEWAMHLTGRYPDDWKGRVFDSPTKLWAAGVTGESTRDNPQRILMGPPQQESLWGTGSIPKDAIKDTTRTRGGVSDSLDSVIVKWGGGGDVQAQESILAFKAYEKGREKWQGETLDGVWFDEEPPMDIYTEGKTRVNAGGGLDPKTGLPRGGIVIVTFTPLLGMSDVVGMFLTDAQIADMTRQSVAKPKEPSEAAKVAHKIMAP